MNLQQEIEADKLCSRLESAQFGIASVKLEGLEVPPELQRLLIERALKGEFDSSDLIQEIRKRS